MNLSRRSFLKLGTITAAGLALPATDILADAEAIATRYWALDQTHLGQGARETLTVIDEVSSAPWWDVARIIGENRYHTTITTDAPIESLRVGDAIAIGDLPEGATAIDGLERQTVHIRHIDRTNGIVTVTTPVTYPSSLSPQADADAVWARQKAAGDAGVWVPNPAARHRW